MTGDGEGGAGRATGRATAADGCGDDGGDDDMRAPERRVPCGGRALRISPRLDTAMTVDGDDGDGRATDGRRMRRTAWWCGSAGAAEGGSAGSMWRFEKSFSRLSNTATWFTMTFDGDERRTGGRGRRTGGVVVRERRRRGGSGGLRALTVSTSA